MKKALAFLVIIASLSCNTNRQLAGGSQIGMRNLAHCYLKNSVALNSNYNGMVISNADDFSGLFYSQTPSGEEAAAPDFKGQMVVALALNTMDNSRIVFTKAEITGKEVNVYGKLETIREETESPVAIATLPRYSDAKTVNFYVDGGLVKTITVSFKNNSNTLANIKTTNQQVTLQKATRKKPAVI